MRRDPTPEQRLASMVTGLRASGMGMSELARQANVSRTTLHRIEVGDARMPSAETFQRIEAVYLSRAIVVRR